MKKEELKLVYNYGCMLYDLEGTGFNSLDELIKHVESLKTEALLSISQLPDDERKDKDNIFMKDYQALKTVIRVLKNIKTMENLI